MRRLSARETALLDRQSPTAPGHVGTLLVLEAPDRPGRPWGLDDVRAVLEPRLHLVPALRQRVVEAPLGLGAPYWADDPHFDVEFHLREVALPSPGSWELLGEQVARIHARPLDRARPLWEGYVVTGLPEGAVACYAKLHPAVEAASGPHVLDVLLDREPEPREVASEPFAPSTVPSAAGLLRRELTGAVLDPVQALQQAPRTLRHLVGLFGDPPGRPASTLSRSPLDGPVTAHRRVALGSLALADVGLVQRRHDISPDAVVVALVAGALRRWLLDHDVLPAGPLLAAVPGPGAPTLVAVPTHLRDPAERLAFAGEDTGPARREPASLLLAGTSGPEAPVYLAGARVRGIHPLPALAPGTGSLAVATSSYDGRLHVGLVACREVVPDLWKVLGYLREALAELAGER